MCQQKAFGVPQALISQFFAAVMEAIFPLIWCYDEHHLTSKSKISP